MEHLPPKMCFKTHIEKERDDENGILYLAIGSIN